MKLNETEMKELRLLSRDTPQTRTDEEQDRYADLLQRYEEGGGPIELANEADQKFVTLLGEAAEAVGHELRSYSGRSMYGALCIGVDLDGMDQLFELGYALGIADRNQRHDHYAQGVCIDSMGRGVIVYWPQVKLKKEEKL